MSITLASILVPVLSGVLVGFFTVTLSSHRTRAQREEERAFALATFKGEVQTELRSMKDWMQRVEQKLDYLMEKIHGPAIS